MIDKDQYEGHTEGKWIYCDDTIFATAKGGNEIIAEYPCWNYNTDQLITKEEEANLRLMTDAPLLLAEVKRLREAMKTMLDDMNNASPEEDIEYWLDTWKHWLKELIE